VAGGGCEVRNVVLDTGLPSVELPVVVCVCESTTRGGSGADKLGTWASMLCTMSRAFGVREPLRLARVRASSRSADAWVGGRSGGALLETLEGAGLFTPVAWGVLVASWTMSAWKASVRKMESRRRGRGTSPGWPNLRTSSAFVGLYMKGMITSAALEAGYLITFYKVNERERCS
jgi:hypothetical protein